MILFNPFVKVFSNFFCSSCIVARSVGSPKYFSETCAAVSLNVFMYFVFNSVGAEAPGAIKVVDGFHVIAHSEL